MGIPQGLLPAFLLFCNDIDGGSLLEWKMNRAGLEPCIIVLSVEISGQCI